MKTNTIYSLANLRSVDETIAFLDGLDALGYVGTGYVKPDYKDSPSDDTIVIFSEAMAADPRVVDAFAAADPIVVGVVAS